jgi:hypothetical protein
VTSILLLAAAIPGLFVDTEPSPALKEAGVACVAIPATRAGEWKGQCAEPVDPAKLKRIPSPGVNYRINRASASSSPWVETNGARYARRFPEKALVNAGEGRAALAAAEAHVFGVDALINANPKDWAAFAAMHAFLSKLPADPLPNLANIGFIDDGTPAATENMKLMLRRNLLFRAVTKADPGLDLNVKSKPGDPSAFAYEVRQKLTDDKRLIRLYGSEVVVARLSGDNSRRRVSLLNYGARTVEGLRVRVLGNWPKITVHAFGEAVEAADIVHENGATEFSLPRVPVYTVVELAR